MADLTAALVTRINLRDQLLAVYPQLAEDETALIDTLDGLDTLNEQIVAVLRHAIEREAHGKALGELVEAMTARKRRLEEGAKSLRLAVLHTMQEAGLKKLAAPDMTVSVGAGKPKVVITDDAEIPDALCRITKTPDKIAIAKALTEGSWPVPGATLGNPQPFLSIHRK